MPYRRVDKTIEVQKGGVWQTLKAHPTVKAAAKHLMALQLNVKKFGYPEDDKNLL
jgi:hypothetical protein